MCSGTYYYRSYGDPDKRVLIERQLPGGVTTVFSRNSLDQITAIRQGGVVRTFGFGPGTNYSFLISEQHPVTGTTRYGRDGVGNMTSKQINGTNITHWPKTKSLIKKK